jgi:hypothetical protein
MDPILGPLMLIRDLQMIMIISKRITLVRKSNCLKPLKLILLSNYCEVIVAKTKTLGIVKMNKIV